MTFRLSVDESPPDDAQAPPSNVIVRFRVPNQTQAMHNEGDALKRDTRVVAQDDNGQRIGTVLSSTSSTKLPVHGSVLRVANEADEAANVANAAKEQEAFVFCNERIKELNLPMKLVAVEFTQQATQAIFSFSSPERVDFRALVKDLARRFHKRIEMRQIGVRDAARHTGGIGLCGRQTCCSTWLPDFQPISIRMAKDQNLSLNQQKLSGICGRLRCCLQYEQETYQETRKTLPKVGKRVVTPKGEGRVKDVNVLKRRVRVELFDGSYDEFDADDVSRVEAPEQQAAAVRAVPPAADQDSARVETEDSGTAARKRRRRRRGGGGGAGGNGNVNNNNSPQGSSGRDNDAGS